MDGSALSVLCEKMAPERRFGAIMGTCRRSVDEVAAGRSQDRTHAVGGKFRRLRPKFNTLRRNIAHMSLSPWWAGKPQPLPQRALIRYEQAPVVSQIVPLL